MKALQLMHMNLSDPLNKIIHIRTYTEYESEVTFKGFTF
jgi:hypothetical protein